jgi:hypothetical protein
MKKWRIDGKQKCSAWLAPTPAAIKVHKPAASAPSIFATKVD